ncbi:hypothetical protein B0J17DRAFT_643750 [Rhizoctonia solani]|nr:hypothetical protein B0J17DRAFT_643750 [Rhizoctonia solani]
MQLLAGDQNEKIRMEDVILTLNNIVDDIASMYAGSFGGALMVDSPMEIDASVKNDDQQEANLSARPDSPTLSEPPLSARSTGNSDSEDSSSLYSANLEPSPTSSGFTTPPLSPTSLIFITDKDTAASDTASITLLVDVDKESAFVPGNTQFGTPTSLGHSLGMNTESAEILEINTSGMAPISILEVPGIKLESSKYLWMSSPLFPEQDGVEMIYQTSASSPATPRPIHPRDSPPHLSALGLPTFQPTPRLDQNEAWDTASRMNQNELGAAHLVRQRQWARLTIMHASSLAEPQDLPPCRPVDKYLEWGFYSPSSVSPPRKRIIGAMSRRVQLGPRTLSRGDWDPERRGGAIDLWNNREALRRERMRAFNDTEQDHRPKLKPVVPLKINTSRDYRKGSTAKCEIYREAADEGDISVSTLRGKGSAQGDTEVHEGRGTSEGDQDIMRLCVMDGKRVLSGPSNSDSGLQSKSKGLGKTVTTSTCEPPVSEDPNTMRWCVKSGVRASPPARNPAAKSNSGLEIGACTDAQNFPGREKPIVPGSLQETLPFDRKRIDAEYPYAPKKKSPLGRNLLPVSSATMKFQLRAPGDALGLGKTRRKFASMMF